MVFLWSYLKEKRSLSEQNKVLSSEEFKLMYDTYEKSFKGNFEDKIHLVRRDLKKDREKNS